MKDYFNYLAIESTASPFYLKNSEWIGEAVPL
jgi:hypothetical protein